MSLQDLTPAGAARTQVLRQPFDADDRPRVVFDPKNPPPIPDHAPPWNVGAYELGEVACPVTGLKFHTARTFIPHGEGIPRFEREDWPGGRDTHPIAAVDQFVNGRVPTYHPGDLGVDPEAVGGLIGIHAKTWDLGRAGIGQAIEVSSLGEFVQRTLNGDFGDDGQAEDIALPSDNAFPYWPVLSRPVRSMLAHNGRIEWFVYGRFTLSLAKENQPPLIGATPAQTDQHSRAAAALSSYNPLGVVLYRMPSVPSARWPQGVRCIVSPEPFLREAGIL